MGKVKRRGISESAAQKGNVSKKKLNPFEIHVNRQKFNVIGQKSKSDRGLPGISRSRAVMKRKESLLKEYKVKDKSNKFFDRRIGEKNRDMSYEDKVVARYTAERMKMFKKKQIYNLADDEILTHRGQTLSEIEKFDDPRSSDDEDDPGKLGANFVEDAHFGGLKRSAGEEKRSRKDLIEQLISESKKRKAEKQHTREQTIELTDKLDTDWQDLLPIVTSSKRKPTDSEEVDKPDSYDRVMRELKFEARGQASDRLKTEDEIEKEERDKRAQLEAEREKRMQTDVEKYEQSSKHRSADDLDDGFAIDDEPDVTLSYDFEGNVLLDTQIESAEIEKGSIKSSNLPRSSEGKKESDEDSEDESDEDDDDDDGDDDDNNDDDGETDDSLSDLKPVSDSEMEQDSTSVQRNILMEEEEKKGEPKENEEEEKGHRNENDKINNKFPTAQRQNIISNVMSDYEKNIFLQEVRKKFPNFANIPEKYETLQKLLKQCDAEKQSVIVTHIMNKNNVSLYEINRSRLETLFKFLLKHINDSSIQSPSEGLKVLNSLGPQLYDLIHISPENTSQSILDVLKEKQEEFQKHKHKYPSFDTLIIFKIISLLYPTSDFRHRVVTPSIVFMCQMLFQCHIKTKQDISKGLFLVTLFLEFTVLSKRFSPGAINFLCGVLHLAIPKPPHKIKKVLPIPPFRKFGPWSELLVLESKMDEHDEPLQMKITDLSEEAIDTSFKIRALTTTLNMLKEFQLNLNNLEACSSIFHNASVLLSKLPVENYPSKLQSEIQNLSTEFQRLKDRPLKYLVIERKRPKALRLYEPSFQPVFDGKRRRPMGEEKMEREKLLHKIKREKKSAIREIRRDNTFLAKVKWKETVQSDMERVQKVKEIFGSASNQLGEIRSLERKKKYMK